MEPKEDILVSICCITYNHEKYIAQNIESYLMQETSFKFEIIIGEDCSTDNTLKILQAYQRMHPELITLVTSEENVGSIKNHARSMAKCRGKYIAMCDGDDYWTSPLKLQKQVDFLEANPEYIICCNYSQVINENEETVYVHPSPVGLEFTYEDLLFDRKDETRICSLMVRNCKQITDIELQDWYYRTHAADRMFKLYVVSNGKKIYVIPEVMSCYRIHTGGVWSMIDTKLRKSKRLSDFNLIIKHFKHNSLQKRALLKIYLKQYLIFEIRQLKFNHAIQTISALW